jgi:hemoglobin
MRHAPFKVTIAQRDRWLKHMMAAVDSLDLTPEDDHILRDYFHQAAQSLVNSRED